MRFQPVTVIDAFDLACIYECNYSLAYTLNNVDHIVDIIPVVRICTMETA